MTEQNREDQEVLLVTASDENEANILQSLLEANNIPSLRKHRGNGDYLQIYMGVSYLGIDIFVMKSRYEEAKALITAKFLEDTEAMEVSEENMDDEIQDQGDEVPDQEDIILERKNHSLMIYSIVIFVIILIVLVHSKVSF